MANREERLAYQRAWKAKKRAEAQERGEVYDPSRYAKRERNGDPDKRKARAAEHAPQRRERAKEQRVRVQHNHPPPLFAAFDGEGTNMPDGDQYYTLLAYSDPKGQHDYIENYTDGLSTESCFRFLLKHPPRRGVINTGFFFTYDVTKIIRDLSEDEKSALWHSGFVFWQGGSGVIYWIRFIPNKLLKVGVVNPAIPLDRNHFRPHDHLVHSTTLFDVSGFFQCRFTKALKDWKVAEDYLAFVTEMKAKRNDFTKESRDDIRRYCLIECDALVALMTKLASALWDAELRLTAWHGAGAVADSLFRQHGVEGHIAPLPSEVLTAALGAYFGGRAEIFRQGIITEAVHDYDLQSAYPSAAIHLPSLRDAQWEYIDDAARATTAVTTHPWTLALVSWDVTHVVDRRVRPLAIPGPLPYRHKGRVSFPYVAGPTWTHGLELRAALALFPAECFTVHTCWILHPSCSDRPFGFLEDVARDRIAAKQAGEWKHIPMKLGMNSVYGKLAQGQIDPDHEPPYLNYYWAGAITAMTRAKLLTAALLAGDGLIAIMTDGLFTTTAVDVPLGKEPGSWEDAGTIDEPIIIQAGIMYARDGSLMKTRGFAAESLNYETACAEWRSRGPFGVVRYSERRFVGLGSCAARHDFGPYGRWLDVDRNVNFQMFNSPKTPWPDALGFTWGIDCGWWTHHEPDSFWVIPKPMPDIPSQLFVPRPLQNDAAAWAVLDARTAQEMRDLALMKIEHNDQPEWDDEWEEA